MIETPKWAVRLRTLTDQQLLALYRSTPVLSAAGTIEAVLDEVKTGRLGDFYVDIRTLTFLGDDWLKE